MQFAKSKIFIIRLFTEKVCYACSRVTEGRLLPGVQGWAGVSCPQAASSVSAAVGWERVLNSVNLLRTYYMPDTGDKAESETRLCPRKVDDSLRNTREGACHYHTERNTLGMSATARGTAPLTRKFPGTCEVKRGQCCKRGAGTDCPGNQKGETTSVWENKEQWGEPLNGARGLGGIQTGWAMSAQGTQDRGWRGEGVPSSRTWGWTPHRPQFPEHRIWLNEDSLTLVLIKWVTQEDSERKKETQWRPC